MLDRICAKLWPAIMLVIQTIMISSFIGVIVSGLAFGEVFIGDVLAFFDGSTPDPETELSILVDLRLYFIAFSSELLLIASALAVAIFSWIGEIRARGKAGRQEGGDS